MSSKELKNETHEWTKALLIYPIFLGLAWPLTLLAPFILDLSPDVHYYPIELTLVVFIYWLTFVGYFRMKIIFPKVLKVSSSSLSTSEAEKLLVQLKSVMTNDKLYLIPTLKRENVSQQLGVNPKTISTILNQHFKQNFNDFINDHRLREVCERLNSAEEQHLTITGIALNSGFNSQATFQRVFKKSLGMSPREYLQKESKKLD